MKQITILLSSVLTLLLITGNNVSYAAPHYSDYGGKKFQGNKPNMNSGGRFMPKRNRLGDDISGYGYKNILKKGNVFRGDVRMLPNRNSGGGRFNPTSKYSISDEPAFIPKPNRGKFNPTSKYSISDEPAFIPKPDAVGKAGFIVGPIHRPGSVGYNCKDAAGNNASNGNCIDKSTPKFGGQEGEAFNPTSKYSISDEPAFVPKPDGALGPDVVTTLEHGPGVVNDNDSRIGSTTGVHGVQQPKSVPLKFINGEWVEEQSLKPYAWP
jgi:hypothetical protein